MNKENLLIFNTIIKLKHNSNNNNNITINIETEPSKLISQLELNLISLNENLLQINSLKNNKYTTYTNNNIINIYLKHLKIIIDKNYYIYDNIIDKYMQCFFSINNCNSISYNNINNNNLLFLKKNILKN